jgi:hypothetical protein
MLITQIGTVQKNKKINQQGLYANKAFAQGEILIHFTAKETLQKPNYLTIQISDTEHILLAPTYIEYINHSCKPNVFFNTTTFTLEALKDIAVGEEFTFFYPSTEWKMDQSFICSCGNVNCLKEIQGAYYIAPNIIAPYQLTDYIQQKLNETKVQKTA